MRMTMTKWVLMSLLMKDGTAELILPDGRKGIVDGIQREDGSGRSFMMTVSRLLSNGRIVRKEKIEVYVTTTD